METSTEIRAVINELRRYGTLFFERIEELETKLQETLEKEITQKPKERNRVAKLARSQTFIWLYLFFLSALFLCEYNARKDLIGKINNKLKHYKEIYDTTNKR